MENELDKNGCYLHYQSNWFFKSGFPYRHSFKENWSSSVSWGFMQTVNPILPIDKYLIPNIDDPYSTVSWRLYITRLNLSNAYLLFPLDE